MKKYGLAIDPGLSTGICLFSWDDPDYLDGAFRQEKLWQFLYGAAGLAAWIESHDLERNDYGLGMANPNGRGWIKIETLVTEKFTPRADVSFSLTRASVEPLRGEGVLIGRGLLPYIDWQEPSMQYFMGGADLKDRKKRSREFLKLNGLHVTGKIVGAPDADDAISAQLHAIAWLRKKHHMPTLNEMFGPNDEEK